jgi:putative Mg2+ transporter-C (MgtC) family protein
LFTIFSISLDPENSRTRIAANIVTGIGFLGAGAIVRESGRIGGLTTAATIWLSAALGMGIGAGEMWLSAAATLISLLVLLVFPSLEVWIDRIREARHYRVVIPSKNFQKVEKVHQALVSSSLKILEHHQAKSDQKILCSWRVIGAPANHEKFITSILMDEDIHEFTY